MELPEPEPAEMTAPEDHVPHSRDVQAHAASVDAELFETWERFFEYLARYQSDTHQVFRQRTSITAASRNQELATRGDPPVMKLIPTSFDKYYIGFICTYGWSRASRSKEKRKKYFVKSTGCRAQLSATVVWNARALPPAFQVKITNQATIHNHSIGQGVFDNHPGNRRIDDEGVVGFVDELHIAGAKPKLIMQYLMRRTEKDVTLRDVHNLVSKLKEARRGAATVEARLEAVLRAFCSRKRNTATVYVDDAKLEQTITFQTRQMRRFFEAFPEILLVDATHNTNDARYKLFSFMIHDVFGHVRANSHALMENESAECLTDAVSSFKTFNPTWDKIKVIIIDKDFGEMALLRKAFPGARILLCVLHEIKYLRTEMVKKEYGVLDNEKVEDAVDMMLKAKTEDEYTTGLKYLYFVVEGKQTLQEEDAPAPEHPFMHYFHKNWYSCRQMWSSFGRVDIPHLGNNTNNR
ncbi:hypothetical protein BBJ28_00023817 [Nothophytophthora sp. Chile5]|nr:hypothetical protein BBJ28_00023817 [Nothophytophthora sp. Chile5]